MYIYTPAGLIPIKVNPTFFNFPSAATIAASMNSDLIEDEVVKFRLKVCASVVCMWMLLLKPTCLRLKVCASVVCMWMLL